MIKYKYALTKIEEKDFCEAADALDKLIAINPGFSEYYFSLIRSIIEPREKDINMYRKHLDEHQTYQLESFAKKLKRLTLNRFKEQKISFCIPVKNRSKVSVEWNGVTRKKTFVSSYKECPCKFELFLLKNCVQSIAKSKIEGIEFEIVIVDFDSTDEPPSNWAPAFGSPGIQVKVISLKESFSRGRGLNVAAENATGTILFFLDADMLISRELIYQTLRTNVIDKKAFFPICYSYFTPFHTEGWIRNEGWGNLSITREMYDNNKIKWWEKKSWGSEDDHMRDCLEGLYTRKRGIGFFHQWHPEDDFKTKHYEQKKNKFEVVLGVTTYNRLEYLQDFVNSWLATRNPFYQWTLIFSDDGSTDGTLEYLESLAIPDCKVHLIRHDRTGVHESTNSIIDRCLSINFDYGFKCDDDVVFLQKGWDDKYIDGMDSYPYICNYNVGWRKATPKKLDEKFVSYSDAYYSQGAFWTFTKKVLNKVGWFDTKTFGFKGYGHIDYSVRACRAGFNNFSNFFDIRDSNSYIDLQSENYKPALTENEIKKDFGLVVDEKKKKDMQILITKKREDIIYVKREPIYSFELCTTKPVVHLIIHNNHIGGAEYVHFNHAIALKELGHPIKIWSVGKGTFFDRFIASGFNINYTPKLFETSSSDWASFEKEILDGHYIYNCNSYNDDIFKNLAKERFLYYFTILHSDVDWIIKHQIQHKYFTHKFIAIHDTIKDTLVRSGVNHHKISVVRNTLESNFPFGRNIERNSKLRSAYGISPHKIVVGFVGRIAQDKNALDLIDIFEAVLKKRPDFKFIIIGGESKRTQDKGYNEEFNNKLINSPNKEDILHLGERIGDELYSLLDLIDVSINVSPSEGLPISMLEQLSKGIYCIYPRFPEIEKVLSKFKSTTIDIKQRKDLKNLSYTKEEKDLFVETIVKLRQNDLAGATQYNPSIASDLFSYSSLLDQIKNAFDAL
ncbi:glycosyltransferase [Stutzerimonas stutzeri]|nr:glycosyltransferase [Stutzerimonas stutzeri]MCQ4253826.1 glycosyltransferase [Stutzerimonas stutzeri]